MRPLRWAGDHSRVCLPLPCETDKLQSTPKLFKHKKDQCIDILYIYAVNSGSVGAPVYSLQTLKCSFSVSPSVSKPFLCC